MLVAIDRSCHISWLSCSVQRVADRGDFATTASVVRPLAGRAKIDDNRVKLTNGQYAASESDRQLRWQEHFCSVFSAGILRYDDLQKRHYVLDLPNDESSFQTSPESTRSSFQALGANKGVGTDGIVAELLRAGGVATAAKYDELHQKIRREGWPMQWRGGRMVNVWKRKDDPADCDNHRGILLADHASKAFAGQLKMYVDPVYNVRIPVDQFGATAGRGTDFAHHILRSFIDRANKLGHSFFILFLDLVKAFDRIIRELVFGWPPDVPEDRVQYLVELGVLPHAAEHIAEFIDSRGPIFQQ